MDFSWESVFPHGQVQMQSTPGTHCSSSLSSDPPNSTHAGLICSPGDPTGRARTALSQWPFSQCFYREHLQAFPFVQHILKEKEEQKKEKSVKVQYVFLLLSSLTNSSHLSLPFYEVVFLHWSLSCVSWLKWNQPPRFSGKSHQLFLIDTSLRPGETAKAPKMGAVLLAAPWLDLCL